MGVQTSNFEFQVSNIEFRTPNIELGVRFPKSEITNPKLSHLQPHEAAVNIEVGAGDKAPGI